MLTINKVVIHELQKEARVNEAFTFLSNNVLEISGNVELLLTRLDESYAKDVINYGVFDSSDGRVFPAQFATYIRGERTDSDFLTFSKTTLNNLRDQMRNVNLAKGGFFIFAQYMSQGITYTGIYLIRDTEGVLFKRVDETHSFEVNRVKYMNTEKLAMGCRVNHNKFIAADGNYLSLIKNRQTDISEYFYNWISVLQPESSTEFTNTLYSIVNGIDLPVNSESGQPYSIDDFRRLVVDYVRSRPAKDVNLLEMGAHFYGDNQKIVNYAVANNLTIDHEFRVDTRVLRKFMSIAVNADGINLKFTRGELDRKVRLSIDNPNLVLIDSPRFANALRQEISNG
jgi:nucleoid-associated protein